MARCILWFRRDLRLGDQPALLSAAAESAEVVPVFVLDDVLRHGSGAARLAFLYRTLRILIEQTGGCLRILPGPPAEALPAAAEAAGATAVHISADAGPYGRHRDEVVDAALAAGNVPLRRTGSPYAVTPGRIAGPDGDRGYAVFTPFYRAWQRHDGRAPARSGTDVRWSTGGLDSVGVPDDPPLRGRRLPAAGEAAARAEWQRFRAEGLSAYADRRSLTADGATSRLSVYLKYGCLHPRTLLAELGSGPGEETFRSELAWREFYADVLWHSPQAARSSLRPKMDALTSSVNDATAEPAREEGYAAWCAGRTGYPIVDAAMRHLAAEAWMPNRMRMVVASFLVKDLHQPWQRGAGFFFDQLVDGDLASNNLSWQWVAGTGTDPAPYYRIFNPVRQGLQFDPNGDYVRRWIPELRSVVGPAVHEPWKLPAGVPAGYPERIVDHDAERNESLRRYETLRA
ncbi:MAG: deoxyribodipyrimidine photo-lyase [Frankiaceae bacterium]